MIAPARLLLATLACLLLAGPSRAAQPASPPPNKPANNSDTLPDDRLMVSADFGVDTLLPTEHWAPARFNITSPVLNVIGSLTVRYTQDGSQDAVITTPLTIPAGSSVTAEVLICVPRTGSPVDVSITSESGRLLFRERYHIDDPGRSPRTAVFRPPALLTSPTTILSLGIDPLQDAGRLWSQRLITPSIRDNNFYYQNSDRTAPPFEESYRISSLDPAAAWSSWAAYDGMVAVVAPASALSALPERSRRALFHWVSSGGRLLLYVDDASDIYRQWFPSDPAWNLFTLDSPRPVPLSNRLADELDIHAKQAGTDNLIIPADSIVARPIALSQRARDLGFEPLWDDAVTDALIAVRGPCGFGSLTLISFNPAHVPQLRTRTGATAAWAGVLQTGLQLTPSTENRWDYYYWSSGANYRQSGAISTLIDFSIDAPGIRPSTLILLVSILVFFALAIGPIDAFVLKRLKRRHLSWLTAAAWIALTSVAMLLIPWTQRAGKSEIGRVITTDAILDHAANPITSWQSGLTVTYAGSPGTLGPVDTRPGAFWRGVSPLQVYQYQQVPRPLSPIRAIQQPVAGPDGAQLSTLPIPPSQRVWTVRALLDQAPQAPPIVARIERLSDANDGFRLHLSQANLEIRALSVQIADRAWGPIPAAPGQTIELRLTQAMDLGDVSSISSELRRGIISQPIYLDLPGIDAHADAATLMLRSGAFAAIGIEYTTDQPDLELIGADHVNTLGAVRLIVPVSDPTTQDRNP